MPLLYNTDHQHAIHGDGTATAPGEPHEFTDEQVEAGIAGLWSADDPRAGLEAEVEFKKRRDSRVKPVVGSVPESSAAESRGV